MSAAFSAIIIVGALVLPKVIVGITAAGYSRFDLTASTIDLALKGRALKILA